MSLLFQYRKFLSGLAVLIGLYVIAFQIGKKNGVQLIENKYQIEKELDTKLHQENLEKLTKSLNKAKYGKKIDFNNAGSIDNDFLLEELN